ncbi:YbhB/YbcL family Raf kinase inhibitor-like protein [Schaalia sp. ZJ405]|uniref:YbhB/YbcL family Raf kinase inhibitor-like protein n=1 Tax=Schaalia sp. ZJ405 TaxID=2709403 RepID=UPI0013EC13BB|nr:YbhB/YbcL family Raf kinase inhibitor-like protein [Schaalia sp. ZJ405]QPK82231.1 YbhB/YbcL family Raf kinase inhibitor-like protein [Schaalia sp. ZJ405]
MDISTRPLAANPYDGLPPHDTFTLTSNDLVDGTTMPAIHTASGGSLSPHLTWSDFPQGTESFVVTCFDPDAPTPSGWWHWTIVDIPADQTELPQGAGASDLELDGAAFHLRGDHGEPSYFGAAPPAGDRPHRYIFTVHALDVDSTGLDDEATPAACALTILTHTLARASLTVTFSN